MTEQVMKRCAACRAEKPVAQMKTCMHAEMHNYVCDSKCMHDFYNPPKAAKPDHEAIIADLQSRLDAAEQKYRDELGKRLVGEVKFEQQLVERDAVLRELHSAWEESEGHEKLFEAMGKVAALLSGAEPVKCRNCGGHGVIGWTTGQTAESFDQGEALCPECDGTGEPTIGKYDDVLLPFLSMMRAELHANSGKGDRPGWLKMDNKTALLEIFYHLGKLQKSVKNGDAPGIKEYAADVANMSMMLVDINGLLEPAKGGDGE